MTEVEIHEVVIIGAGLGGLAAAHRLGEFGIDDLLIFESSDGVGGTWRANAYPGAACDVPSHLYSLSFAPNPHWSRTYASQPEILRYVEDCYDLFDLKRKVRLLTTVTSMSWQENRDCWRIVDHASKEYEARVVITAIGMFHTPALPEIPGLEKFRGTVFHSARWNHAHDLSGRQVAVVGTGASAIQVVPAIAPRTARLYVYQRTPAWILPRKNVAFTHDQRRMFASDPEAMKRMRSDIYNLYEQTMSFMRDDPATDRLAEIALGYLERKVPDPELRARLTPHYPIGCKRVLVSSDFYPAIQRHNVELVTERIDRVTPDGVRTDDGIDRACDTIVLCTGFKATEYLRGIEVVGKGGMSLHDYWDGVPRAYLGLCVPCFPNLFLMYGPNTNQGGNSIILILEAQAQFIASSLEFMSHSGLASVEVRTEAMDRYQAELRSAMSSTVWSEGCQSYFRTSAGDIVTQLPYRSGWYAEHTERLVTKDFHT